MNTLAMHLPEAIGTSCFSLADVDGQTVYFSNMEPCHNEGDRPAMLLRIARHRVPQRDLQTA